MSKRQSTLAKTSPLISASSTEKKDEANASTDDEGIQLKTEWKRKGDRVNFFTKEAANADFFDLLKAPAPSLKDRTVIDGYLTKQGGKGIKQNWRKRWFVLTYDKYLYYYKTPQDDIPTGVICLDDYEAVSPVEDAKKKFRFNIHNNNKSTIRVFRLFADGQKDYLQWMSAIEQVFRAPKLDSSRTKIVKREEDDEHAIRRCARLYVRVVEARNLPKAMTGSSTSCYCIVDLADQQVRTQTIWKTREPMWCEEFYLDVHDPDTSVANVTCWRMEKAGKGDVIGKVDVPITSLKDQKQHEQWYPLARADAGQYIAGDVHLKVEYKPQEMLLLVQVVEAKNLAPKGIGGTSNPFIRLHLGKRKKKTKTVNKTLTPTFNDLFELKLRPEDPKELILVLWHREKLTTEFMGTITIPYTELEPNFLYDGWYMVAANQREDNDENTTQNDEDIDDSDDEQVDSPRPEENALEKEKEKEKATKELGDIRIVMKYTEETVLPNVAYDSLWELLQKEDMEIIQLLGKITNEKEDVGRTLARLFEFKGKAPELLINMTCREVEETPDPDVIFRANSLATKAFDYYMKLVGLPYLHHTLEDLVKEIYSTKKLCEVDPTRLEKTDDLTKNFANLQNYVQEFCDAIFNSVEECPHKMRRICHALQQKVISKYPAEQIEIVKYTAVSGFLFLRFFCPAILGPKLFDLMKDHPGMKTARYLTLIAKTLQNLSNLCEFGYKEPYMADMNKLIMENMDAMKTFIDKISTLPDAPRREETPEIQYGVEMATLHRHLLNNIRTLRENNPKSQIVRDLTKTLQRLALIKEDYIVGSKAKKNT